MEKAKITIDSRNKRASPIQSAYKAIRMNCTVWRKPKDCRQNPKLCTPKTVK